LANPEARDALRAAARDQDPKVRESAIRAICESSDVEILPDLLGFATDKENEKVRALAINGCVRLLTQEEGGKVANSDKVDAFKRILAASPNDAEKRIVLSGLARIPEVESLKLADGLLDDAAVQAEAVQAVIKIASTLPSADHAAAKASIDKILSLPIDEQTRTSVTKVSKKL
jgi:HEAT repeat protein